MAKFTPRTTAPSTKDKNWLHTSAGGYNSCIHIKNGSVLPNCVGYAWGRARELLGKDPALSRANAENWWGHKDGYQRGQTPKLGAIICWRKGKAGVSSDGAGHVAVVEKINADGSILTSNSDYGGRRFYTKTYKAPYTISSAYAFQGFIYLPVDFEEEPKKDSFFPAKGYYCKGDQGESVEKINDFYYKVFPGYAGALGRNAKNVLGPYFGDNTKAWTQEFQRRTGLEPDGCFGPLTKKMAEKYGFKA